MEAKKGRGASVPQRSGSTPSIDITVFDEERRFPLNITGGRVFFKSKLNLESGVLVVDQEAEIINGEGGLARVKLSASDTDTVQRLVTQIVVELPGTGTLVSPAFFFDIEESVL